VASLSLRALLCFMKSKVEFTFLAKPAGLECVGIGGDTQRFVMYRDISKLLDIKPGILGCEKG
jgi:hypothetical protein